MIGVMKYAVVYVLCHHDLFMNVHTTYGWVLKFFDMLLRSYK